MSLLAIKFTEGENKLQAMVLSILQKTWYLQKAVRTTARVIKAVLTKDRQSDPPSRRGEQGWCQELGLVSHHRACSKVRH